MIDDMEAYVIGLLETYREREQKISALRYELNHPVHLSGVELIEAMAFGHEEGVGSPGGHVSDKTLYIALNYQDKADKINTHIVDEIAGQLVELEEEQNRLKFYVSLLDRCQAEVIRLTYFEACGQDEASKKVGVVPRTMRRIRKEAISKLVELYSLSKKRRKQVPRHKERCPQIVPFMVLVLSLYSML